MTHRRLAAAAVLAIAMVSAIFTLLGLAITDESDWIIHYRPVVRIDCPTPNALTPERWIFSAWNDSRQLRQCVDRSFWPHVTVTVFGAPLVPEPDFRAWLRATLSRARPADQCGIPILPDESPSRAELTAALREELRADATPR